MSNIRISHVPEVDGLRAFAVIAVLLFHTFPNEFPGGFIGVDVFFTISGYVIARTYLRRLIAGETTLRHFFLKRVRRLAPAYVLVLASSTVVALLIFDPVKLRAFGTSLLAQPFYLQNVTFWIEGDYFSGALTKPLLHTWSLAVEEQFYLLFGVIIVVLRWQYRLMWPVLIAAIGLSLAGGYTLVSLSPKTPFYLVPFRVWEFAAGILVYLVTERMHIRKAGAPAVSLAVIALLGLLFSVLCFDETVRFPGLQSVLSTASVCFLLALFEARPSGWYAMFCTPIARRLGELSYSLYLWHWPLIVFAVMVLDRPLGWTEASIMLAASYALSETTYRTIEDPVRRGLKFTTQPVLVRSWIASSLVLATVGLGLHVSKGATFRYDDPLRQLYTAAQDKSPHRCSKLWRIFNPGAEFCPINESALVERPGVLILGDSHADQLDEVISEAGDDMATAVYLAVRDCDLNEFGTHDYCSDEVLNDLLRQSQELGVQRVLAISSWMTHGDAFTDSFDPSVSKILAAGFDLHISESIPKGELFNPLTRAKAIEHGTPPQAKYTLAAYNQASRSERELFGRLAAEHNGQVTVLRPSRLLCPEEVCEFSTNGYPNYFDGAHLTRTGAERVLPIYKSALNLAKTQRITLETRVGTSHLSN